MEEKDSILGDIKTEEVGAPYFQRLITILFDVIIEISIIVAFYFLFPRELILKLLDANSYMRYVIALIIVFTYRLVCILLFGKTIGMIISRVKYLNSNLQPLTSKEKIIAIIATKTSNIKFYKTY
jgi:hypothetical protein